MLPEIEWEWEFASALAASAMSAYLIVSVPRDSRCFPFESWATSQMVNVFNTFHPWFDELTTNGLYNARDVYPKSGMCVNEIRLQFSCASPPPWRTFT